MFLTSTFLRYSFYAVRESAAVTVASNPSGTFATIIPIAKTRQVMNGYCRESPMKKKKIPIIIEMTDIIAMNLSSSALKGVFALVAVAARLAI